MSAVNVGIGEYHVSSNGDEVIKTFALGSCVAIIVYDKLKKIAGLMHVALPDSSINEEKAQRMPGYFVDTGLPVLLARMKAGGADRVHSWIKITGGSSIMDDSGRFDIGKRNVLAIKKFLWRNQLGIIAEDTGGNISRTVSVSPATGEVVISSRGKKWEL